jgi:malto-oligosyltrehalose trehalohydrolase
MKRHHELPFGAELVPGGVRFRLWAPAAHVVTIAIDGRAACLPMDGAEDGWFALTTDAARAGTRYRYVVDGHPVPDPASRFQPGTVHGASEVIDPAAHEWQDVTWTGRPWHETVLYELHTGAFSARGDFAGVAGHLDQLVALGVTAVELMPVAAFAGRRGWGYDGVLPFAPAAAYGGPEGLKRLVEACHARGLSLFLDVVYNHFGPEGNYLGRYAPGFFTERHQTPWGAAIDFSQPLVRAFYVQNALYWLEEFNLDGLRFDAVHAIVDDSKKHILTEIAETVHARIARPVHLVLENDKNEAWPLRRGDDAQWNDDLHHALHVLASGEDNGYYADYADHPVARLARGLAEGFIYQGDRSRFRDGEKRGEPSADLPPTAFVAFIQNHDQVGNRPMGERLSDIADAALLRLVVAIMLLAPEIPLLFMGEEWATTRRFPYFCDFDDELAQKIRAGRAREFAGFPGFDGELPDPCAAETFSSAKLDWSARDEAPHRAWLDWYRNLIAIRRRELVPLLVAAHPPPQPSPSRGEGAKREKPSPLEGEGWVGGATAALIGESALAVTWRLPGGQWQLHANFGAAPVRLANSPAGELIFATTPLEDPTLLPPRTALFHKALHG